MSVSTFDIFRGAPDKDAMWLEAVEELGIAFDRMKELAAESPGPYFVFDTKSHKTLAFINTAQTAKADGKANVV